MTQLMAMMSQLTKRRSEDCFGEKNITMSLIELYSYFTIKLRGMKRKKNLNYRRFLFIDGICPSIEARKETFKRGFLYFESALNVKIVQEIKHTQRSFV